MDGWQIEMLLLSINFFKIHYILITVSLAIQMKVYYLSGVNDYFLRAGSMGPLRVSYEDDTTTFELFYCFKNINLLAIFSPGF